jgi:hypothetical protein
MRRLITTAVLTVVAAALVLVGFILAGRQFRSRLQNDPRYLVSFQEIECPAPPGSTRIEFLHEVQFLAELPENLSTLDDSVESQLRTSFARHSWVEKVDRVQSGPGRRIHVELTFRKPVLAAAHGNSIRAVDANGVVLPSTAPVIDLPRLIEATKPASSASTISDAARLAGFLHSDREQLRIREISRRDKGWHLLLENGALALWGEAPGSANSKEPSPELKRDMLLKKAPAGGLIDLRATGTPPGK